MTKLPKVVNMPMGRLNVQPWMKKYRDQKANYDFFIECKRYSKIIIPQAIKLSDIDHDFQPSSKNEEWTVIKEQSYTPDKVEYTVTNFKTAFPNVTLPEGVLPSYDLIGRLASRSSVITEWLAINNAEYALEAQMPTYLEDVMTPEEYKKTQSEVTAYNKVIAEQQKEKQKASEIYKENLKKIDDKYNKQLNKIKENKKLKILTLPSTSLPLTLQLAIENYTPTGDDPPTKRTYLREILTNYKIYLLKELDNNKDINLDQLIEQNQLK